MALGTSNVLLPTQNAVKTYVDNKTSGLATVVALQAETQNRIDADNALNSRVTANADSISAIDNELDTYGNIVTHNVSEFATAAQGVKANTAVQPNDNISELTNDATYQTQAQVNTSIATHNTSTTAHQDIRTAISGKQDTLTAGDNIDITGAVISATDTTYTAGNGLTLTGNEFSANVINNTNSDSITDALSAAAGKSLQEQVNNLLSRGKYLSIWDCTTGLAMDEPPVNPYTVETGSYFIIGKVASADGVNYRPNGGVYDKDVPSTTVETGDVKVNDTYYYDGTQWRLLATPEKEVSFSALAGSPYDNTDLASALNSKQATISDLTTIRNDASAGKSASDTIAGYGDVVTHDADEFATAEQGAKADTALQPGDNISDLTNDSNYQTQAQVNTAISTHNTSTSAHQDIRTELAGKADSSEIPTKTSDLTNDSGFITSSSVGDGTITITQGGTTKGTFTTNQSGNTTIALDSSGGGNVDDVKVDGISVVTDKIANIDLTGKQDTLTAGTNITIIDNVISATGSGGTTDFDILTNRPKYNNTTMSHTTNIPEVKTSTWDGKQDAISDLSTIRSGAALGATAAQPAGVTSAISTHNSSSSAHSDMRGDIANKSTCTLRRW